MANNRATPPGYMTVGEVAKKMGVSVRTLQYYDKKGLLPPSAESEGRRRLYTDKDVIKLYQILSLKSLGFSLEDIRERLISLNTPEEVAKALTEQADMLRAKIKQWEEALRAIEALRGEVMQMKTVNLKKYADIIVNLQMKNEYYFLIKHFDDETLEHIRKKFDAESGKAFIRRFTLLSDRILALQQANVPQDSEECQSITKEFWEMVLEFTGGDMTMLARLTEIGNFTGEPKDWMKKQAAVNAYIGPALEIYLNRLGANPFEGEKQ